jgi:adenylyltransferase/sulfurtransferase
MSRLHKLNPDVQLEAFAENFNATNTEDHIKGMDVILDGLDSPETRYVVNRTCFRLGVPYVFGGAIGTAGNATTVVPGRTLCLECFMTDIRDDDVPKCGVLGVHPSILGVIASAEVFEAVRLIIGKEPNLLNRFLYVDLDEMMFHTFDLTRREDCPVCGSHTLAQPDPVPEKFFEETCARDGRRNFFISPGEKAEIDLEKLKSLLQKTGFKVKSSGEFGITFDLSSHEVATILKSGAMIVQASPKVIDKPKERLFETYRALLVEGLGLSDQIVPEI